MAQGKMQAVIVGADRIAANGDTANKIGTYTVAVLAREHGIPFYVAAPFSTIDLETPDGSRIPIEQRAAARGDAHRRHARSRPSGVRVEQSGLRRHPGALHRRHHHRTRHRPGALRRVDPPVVRDRCGGACFAVDSCSLNIVLP